MSNPKRYSIFNPQEQENPNGAWVHYSDYAKLDAEKWRWANKESIDEIDKLKTINELLMSVVNKFFNSDSLQKHPDTQSYYALAENLKQLPDSILDFTEEQVRDNPAWALAVFRHQMKQKTIDNIGYINEIGGQQEYIHKLKEEVKRLTDGIKAIDPLILEAINSTTLSKDEQV